MRLALWIGFGCAGIAAADVVPVSRWSRFLEEHSPEPHLNVWEYTEMGYHSEPFHTTDASAGGASGALWGYASNFGSGASWVAYNRFRFEFDVTRPVQYRLSGLLTKSFPGSGDAWIGLTGPGAAAGVTTATMQQAPFDFSGTLTPGRYTLNAEIAMSPFTTQNASNTFTLVLDACYANCDRSTAAPVLNVADFSCFLSRFAAGDGYANCDASTAPPVLNVADFACFLQQFAAGCGR